MGSVSDRSSQPIVVWDSDYFSAPAAAVKPSETAVATHSFARTDHDRMSLSMVICEEDDFLIDSDNIIDSESNTAPITLSNSTPPFHLDSVTSDVNKAVNTCSEPSFVEVSSSQSSDSVFFFVLSI